MLWKKDQKNPTLYADLFVQDWMKALNSKTTADLAAPLPVKSDAISLENRKIGNKVFARCEWSAAMEKYNDSLRFAESGSENISLAYANRSACFFKMQLFNECLIDIELAKAAGYPERLMPKLERRTAECMKCLEECGEPDDFGSKLSYVPDDKYPCMANVLKVERGADGKCWAYAKEDIDVGKTIVIEKAYTSRLYMKFGWKCSICLKDEANLMACPKCPQAMFCSKECQEHFMHGYDCGIGVDSPLNGPLKSTVQFGFMAIRMFPNLDDLMDFVEQTIKSDPNDLPESLVDDKSKYRAYIKLPHRSTPQERHLFPAYQAYDMFTNHPMVKPLIRNEKHKRFVMHFLLMHGLLPMQEAGIPEPESIIGRKPVYSQTELMKTFFDHSCSPNVLYTAFNGRFIYNTIRPVKKGEQLTYGRMDLLMKPKAERQRVILEQERLVCKCARCTTSSGQRIGPSEEERRLMASDPDYLKITSFRSIEGVGAAKINALSGKCVTFFNKFNNVKWCNEIGEVLITFANILEHRIKSKYS